MKMSSTLPNVQDRSRSNSQEQKSANSPILNKSGDRSFDSQRAIYPYKNTLSGYNHSARFMQIGNLNDSIQIKQKQQVIRDPNKISFSPNPVHQKQIDRMTKDLWK